MKRAILATLLLFSFCPAFAEEAPKIDFGKFEGSTFVHQYFGFRISIPADWHIQDSEARERLMNMGKEIMAGDNQNMKAVLDVSDLTTLNLLTVFRHPLGAAVDFNPSYVCVAEKVSHLPGIKKGSDYLFHTRKVIEQGQLKYKFDPKIGSESFDGVSFDFMNTELDLNRVLVKQKFYATIRKGYAFCMVVSYQTEEMKEALAAILKSIQFQEE